MILSVSWLVAGIDEWDGVLGWLSGMVGCDGVWMIIWMVDVAGDFANQFGASPSSELPSDLRTSVNLTSHKNTHNFSFTPAHHFSYTHRQPKL